MSVKALTELSVADLWREVKGNGVVYQEIGNS